MVEKSRTGKTVKKNKNQNENQNKNENKNATQYIHRLIYWLALVRQRKGRFPGQIPEYHLLKRQRICILPGTSRPSAETNRADEVILS